MFHWDKEDRDYAAFERYFNRGWEDSDSDDYWMSNSNYFMQHSKREKNYLQQELYERSFDEHLSQKDIFFIKNNDDEEWIVMIDNTEERIHQKKL